MGVVKNVMEMTWVEIRELDKGKTVLFVTIAPIEEHSHHLPLGTDIYEGERWRNDTIDNLSKKLPDYNLLYLPPIPIACAGIPRFYGSIHFKQSTVRQVISELLVDIAAMGIKNIIIIASHGDPQHQIAIEEACSKINRKYGICAFSPLGAFFSYQQLNIDLEFPEKVEDTIKQYANDFHAGWIETSTMLDTINPLVGDNYRNLPDIEVKDTEMMFPGKISKKIAGYGHIGYPRAADQSLGTLLNKNTSEYLVKAITAFINRDNYQQFEHHFLYRIPILKTNFLRNIICGLVYLTVLGTILMILL